MPIIKNLKQEFENKVEHRFNITPFVDELGEAFKKINQKRTFVPRGLAQEIAARFMEQEQEIREKDFAYSGEKHRFNYAWKNTVKRALEGSEGYDNTQNAFNYLLQMKRPSFFERIKEAIRIETVGESVTKLTWKILAGEKIDPDQYKHSAIGMWAMRAAKELKRE